MVTQWDLSATCVCIDCTGKQGMASGARQSWGDHAGVTDGGKVAADISKAREGCWVPRDLTLSQGKAAM